MTMLRILLLFCCCYALPTTFANNCSFEDWLVLHEKAYDDEQEYQRRREIFTQNSALVGAHNVAHTSGLTSYSMTMESPFSDLTDKEFEQTYLMAPQECSATHKSSGQLRPTTSPSLVPEKGPPFVDWRTHGIMTPVKNQKHCGSCWTFSTTGCLEAHICLAADLDCTHWSGLAEQQLLDCAADFNNFGCNGGLPSQAFEYIKYSGGIDLESSYKYTASSTSETCLAKEYKTGGKVAEVFNITEKDEADLIYAVGNIGPVSIAYQVSPDFRFYQQGVYDSYNATTGKTMCQSGSQDVNHAVVAVGLGSTEDGEEYYIVRNSWSTSWGMEGHFWIKRGENLCGLSDCASFPIVPTGTSENVNKLLRGSIK